MFYESYYSSIAIPNFCPLSTTLLRKDLQGYQHIFNAIMNIQYVNVYWKVNTSLLHFYHAKKPEQVVRMTPLIRNVRSNVHSWYVIVLLLRQLRNVRAYNEKNSGTNLHILYQYFIFCILGFKYDSNRPIRTMLMLYILV